MADLLASSQPAPSHTVRNLLLIALVLAIAASVGFGFFYHHENHADAEGEVSHVLVLPLHTKYAHVKNTVGADSEEDTFYVVTVLRVRDRSYAPLFLKDIVGDLRLQDGQLTAGTRVKAQDMDRLLAAVPQLKPLIAAAGVKPLQPEQEIAPNTTAEGYVVFQYPFVSTLWERRQAASIRIDFYKQDALTMTVPK